MVLLVQSAYQLIFKLHMLIKHMLIMYANQTQKKLNRYVVGTSIIWKQIPFSNFQYTQAEINFNFPKENINNPFIICVVFIYKYLPIPLWI